MGMFRDRRGSYAREERDVRYQEKRYIRGLPRGIRWLEAREREYSDSDSDSDSDSIFYDERDRSLHRYPRQTARMTDIVVKPKEKEAKPGECKYMCCQCHIDKREQAERFAKACTEASSGQIVCHLAGGGCCAPAAPKKPEERFPMDVKDRTDGPMARRHGSRFTISISPKANIGDIMSILTPDPARHKIMVEWDDGVYNDLETVKDMDELKNFAWRLVITRRKQVRFRG